MITLATDKDVPKLTRGVSIKLTDPDEVAIMEFVRIYGRQPTRGWRINRVLLSHVYFEIPEG